MSDTAQVATSVTATFDRLLLTAMLIALAAALTAAMVMQYAFGEIPCPLCLLQRYAMFGCCFGIVTQLRSTNSQRGAGIGAIFALMLLVISARQTLLDLIPRPGHAYVGSSVFGMHMPVWSVLIAVALLAGFAARLALFGAPRSCAPHASRPMDVLTRYITLYVVLICAVNFASVVVQCGTGECHTTGYALLSLPH
jgi:disulfide bond formation protein DsbB